MILTRKRQLRLIISQQTALLPRSEKIRQANRVFELLQRTDTFLKATNIALFWSLSNEIPTHDFIEKWAGTKNIYLPVITDQRMELARYIPGCKMIQGILRVLVPEGTEGIDTRNIEMFLVPGVAFDPGGGRMGRGKGYYDRFLENMQAPKIGICFDHQLVDRVPAEPHDEKVDMVISPSAVYNPGTRSTVKGKKKGPGGYMTQPGSPETMP